MPITANGDLVSVNMSNSSGLIHLLAKRQLLASDIHFSMKDFNIMELTNMGYLCLSGVGKFGLGYQMNHVMHLHLDSDFSSELHWLLPLVIMQISNFWDHTAQMR